MNRAYVEICINVAGPVDIVMGEIQKVFDATLEIEPGICRTVDFDYTFAEEE